LIRAYVAEGNVCEAVRQFESFRKLLADELGIEPSTHVTSLLTIGGQEQPVVGNRHANLGVHRAEVLPALPAAAPPAAASNPGRFDDDPLSADVPARRHAE
jgi:hypothetical protein